MKTSAVLIFDLPAVIREEIQHVLPELMLGVPATVYRNVRIMQEGVSADFSITMCNHLYATYAEKWIGRGGPVAWLPRFRDRNPLVPPETIYV
ncbi:hypothetical protein TNCV_516301 [Trichonephila clavipes]|nr:hypothetical protein TNCV_516301 [Trichonephila clavipes]